LKGFFMDIDTSASHWDQWQIDRAQSGQNFTNWGDHPTILKLLFQEVFGHPELGFIDYLRQTYPALSGLHALSLCSGDGAFERSLVTQGVFKSMVGMDISPQRVAQARLDSALPLSSLNFEVGDVNLGAFGVQTYDVVFAKAALHHVVELEVLVKGISACLRPGGAAGDARLFWPYPVSVDRGPVGSG
jgi:2-polyprenyl-3-methyl-5-hydroxy-6-metoxy-1,4-benzoquinol methylase